MKIKFGAQDLAECSEFSLAHGEPDSRQMFRRQVEVS